MNRVARTRRLGALLGSSKYQRFLDLDPMGVQLPSFIATVEGLKPGMDFWVSSSRLSAIPQIAGYFDLKFYTDVLFDRQDETTLGRFPPDCFNTTRAALASVATESCEAHIFIARRDIELQELVSSGWYPLAVDQAIVAKPYPDHDWFGSALGYPECCRRFFHQRNDWRTDNTYFAAYSNTKGSPRALCNTLSRHTAYYLAPHIPCSFSCNATANYAFHLETLIRNESPLYSDAILACLRMPMLCLSELRLFLFEGRMDTPYSISYRDVAPIPPTESTDQLFDLLNRGDSLLLENCVVRVRRGRSDVGAYLARSDVHGPNIPFIVECT